MTNDERMTKLESRNPKASQHAPSSSFEFGLPLAFGSREAEGMTNDECLMTKE